MVNTFHIIDVYTSCVLSLDIAVKVIHAGSSQCLLFLLNCDHILLKNEGLAALNVVAALQNGDGCLSER